MTITAKNIKCKEKREKTARNNREKENNEHFFSYFANKIRKLETDAKTKNTTQI